MSIIYFWSKILKKSRGCSIKNSIIHKKSKIESGTMIVNSYMDKHSFCGYDCVILNTQIGKYCSIASNVKIGLANHPYTWVSTSPVFYRGKDSIKKKFSQFERDIDKTTTIGNDVWIGENVMIKQGLNIGHGAIVAMGSIVTKDVIPYSIVGGNPAKLLKMRFDEQVIEKMIDLKWWDLDEAILEQRAKFIKNPNAFIKESLK